MLLLCYFLLIILIGIVLSFSFLWLCRQYKESKSVDEKSAFIIIVLICFIPLLFYYIDRFDIPTKIGFIKTNESEKWFNFLSTYISTIIGTVINVVILVLVTYHEFKNIRNSDREQRRIDNMPLLEYHFSVRYNDSPKYSHNLCKKNNTRSLNIIIDITNIGMNTVRKCYVSVSSKCIKNCYDYKIDHQEIIKKGDKKSLNFRIPVSSSNEKISFIIKYQDILFNWYTQVVDFYIDNIVFDDQYRNISADLRKCINDEKYVNDSIKLNIK